MQQLKGLFPNSPLAKHQPLHVVITPPGPFSDPKSRTLIFSELGKVNDGRIAKEFFLAYFEGPGISPAVSRVLLMVQFYLFGLMLEMRPQMKKDVEETVSGPHWPRSGNILVDL